MRKIRRSKITSEIRLFIDEKLTEKEPLSYSQIREQIRLKFDITLSKASICKRAKALNIHSARGRRRIIPDKKRPSHTAFLDCAGAFFLKGAEREIRLLDSINQVLQISTDSPQAIKAHNLAKQINALLLFSPAIGLTTPEEIAAYPHKGLLYLTGQTDLPSYNELKQYLQFLIDNRLLLLMFQEVAKSCSDVLSIAVEFAGQTFYLDAQLRSVWPSREIPAIFASTLNTASSYIEKVFLAPSPKNPLILQVCPGYTFLPQEMLNLVRCFEQIPKKPISRVVIAQDSGEVLASWRDIKPNGKYFFLVPLSPWQYEKLQGTRIIRDFHPYYIGPDREPMAVADAEVNLFDSQLNENIKVRAALIKRQQERMAIITNISEREERYIRKIADLYFWRWYGKQFKNYYDLLEEAHQKVLGRPAISFSVTALKTIDYVKKPMDGFRLLLEYLNSYAQTRFFPSSYASESLEAMREKFYAQGGYLRRKKSCWDIMLRPFPSKDLQKSAQLACQQFNQSGLKFPARKDLHLRVQLQQGVLGVTKES